MRLTTLLDKSSYKGISIPFILFIFLTLIMLAVSFTVSNFVESKDSFCGTKCHVQPENRFYDETLGAKNISLAVLHAKKQVRCIDCHSRPNITGKLWAQINGLKNAIAYLTESHEPLNKTTRPVGESGCTKCHSEIFWSLERPSHYHSPLLNIDWKKVGGPPNICEVCHPSHSQEGDPSSHFMIKDQIHKQCKKCHKATGDERIKHLLDLDKLELQLKTL
ncbi:MAG: hypothetical protein OEY59_01125 [Deltaproteobacteria bacterium]|nr:hypothetical protein [Deltaproteobacteria bacterium]